MPVVIKEMHIRTVVEKRIVTEVEVSEELIRKIENRVRDRLDAEDSIPTWFPAVAEKEK